MAGGLGGGARETSWRLEAFKKRLIEVQKQPFSVNDLKIDGNDVMRELNLKPGPQVGEILNKLFGEVVNKKLDNNKEDLLNKVFDFIDKEYKKNDDQSKANPEHSGSE